MALYAMSDSPVNSKMTVFSTFSDSQYFSLNAAWQSRQQFVFIAFFDKHYYLILVNPYK